MMFFDVDHTLTRHSTGRRFMEQGLRMGHFSPRLLLHMPLFYIRYRMGMITQRDLRKEVAAIRGRTRAELTLIADAAVAFSMQHDLFQDAVETVTRFQAQGIATVIATSSLDILVRPLAERLGMDGVIATELEFENGVATGRALGIPCVGDEKLRRVLEFIRQHNAVAADCGFYTDSVNDLPVLSAVGTPVAVNPDPRLRRIALRNGWQVLRFRR
ncbi:MAG: HAD-IB family hydrolase [Spirochaetaceae bacterium]|nr:MAG: HAD-IB family hydrolase [Spirochaetaceae bacterium]